MVGSTEKKGGKALDHVRTQLVEEEEESQESVRARLNVSRHPRPDRQAAAGPTGG